MKLSIPSMIQRTLMLFIVISFTTQISQAEKILAMMYADIHMSDGTERIIRDPERVAIPMKKKQLYVMNDAYTAKQKIGEKIDPMTVDSVVLFNPTAPERTHTMVFIPDYGWCWQLDKGPRISVYAWAPKNGYRISGNGGMWTRGKSFILVIKDGIVTKFGKTDKQSDNKFRRKLATMVADDPELTDHILNARGRRDKILRSLSLYSPAQ